MMEHHPPRQLSLEERQRHILEKGLKRRPQRIESLYENDSASGEDPLAGAPSSFRHLGSEQQQRRELTMKHGRVMAIPRNRRSMTPQTENSTKCPSQNRVAVVLTPTPKKDREEFVTVKVDEERLPKRRAASVGEQSPAPTPDAPHPERMNRRGRPKGWKPGMAYTDLRPRSTAKPSTATSTGSKRRGRPPKLTSATPREVYRRFEAGFFAFLCEWQGCSAELHNLATLRRHVHVVHGEEGSRRGCRWGLSCGTVSSTSTDTAGRSFRKHIEAQHLIPMAWHVGDGPRHQGDGIKVAEPEAKDNIPRWLKDEDGKQVTEGIWEQQLEDLATWKENRRKLKELLIRRDANLPSEEEEEEEEAGEAVA